MQGPDKPAGLRYLRCMDNIDLDVLRRVLQWQQAGHRVVMGTITRTWGSAPRPPGSMVAIRDDGLLAGSVSGGCIEDDLIDKARQGALLSERPQLIRYGIDADAAHRFGLPCGGMIELVMEPVLARTRLPELLQRLGRGEPVRRVLELATGEVTLEAGSTADELALTETHLVTHLGPHWRLLVIGAGQMTQVLAQMAMALGYQVLVCDPREEYAAGFDVPGCRLLRAMPDDAVLSLPPDGHTAIVALTHDPKLDDLALMEALKSPAFYVGAIGSRVNQARRKARLAEHFGLDEAALERLHGPVGLKNGARTPPEIAVSILAELTAVRYGYRVPEPVAAAAVAVVGRGCTLAP
jgi:xanthine dehydrogenase accessory factor